MARRRLTTFLATVVLATGLSAGPALALGGGLLDDPLGEVGTAVQDTTDEVTGLLEGGSDGDDADDADPVAGVVDGVVDDASEALVPVTGAVREVTDEVADVTREVAGTTRAEPLADVADAVEQLGTVLSSDPEPTPTTDRRDGQEPATSSPGPVPTRAVVPPGVRAAEGLPLTGAPDLDLATPRAAAAATARAMAAPRQEVPLDPAVAPPAARDEGAAVASPQVAAPSSAQQVVQAVRDAATQVPPGLRAAAAAMVLAVIGGLVLHRDELLAEISRLGRG